jgi:adenylate cyclase
MKYSIKNLKTKLSHSYSWFSRQQKSFVLAMPKIQKLWQETREKTGIVPVAIVTISVSSLLIGARHFTLLQPLELMVYDQMVRLQPDPGPDPRLLIVTLTEEDIQKYNWPIKDEILAKVLAKLSQYKAKVIGLDIYRDLPVKPGYEQLREQFQNPNVIAIKNLLGSSPGSIKKGVNPPPGIPPGRIGINDIPVDPDGTVRRQLMIVNTPEKETYYSLSMQVAMKYLAYDGIEADNSPDDDTIIFWGKARFQPLKPNSGAYEKVETGGYQILLNYRSGKKVAPTVSIQELLEGDIDPNLIQDKIVLIGANAASLRDIFLTPYRSILETEKMPGVFIHAQMVSQLIDAALGKRPLFSYWPEWVEIIWISSWVLIGTALARYREPLFSALASPVLLCVLGGLSFALFLNAKWVPVATPAIGFIFSSASIVAYRAHQSQEKEKIVMRLLGQNTSPEIANALWKGRDRLLADGRLPGEKVMATVMFTDVKNFSTFSEEMPPERLMEWLNEYLSAMTEIIQEYRGIINKFMGDGIMAAFGVPVARTTEAEIANDAKAAVGCALAIGERLKILNADWKVRDFPVISMRVGIFTGPIVAGSLGGKERLEYGLLGDTVNTASRLESCEKIRQPGICRILIAYQTLIYIENEFVVEPWGPIPLKGKQQIVYVYRVISRKK